MADYTDYSCPKCGSKVYDNRHNKRNPKAPDAKCSNKTCDFVQWPPKNGEPTGDPTPSITPGAYKKANEIMHAPDERENRIQRQHSQEMALRFFALNGTVPNTKQLRDMTSWFQRDIAHTPEKEEREHTW